jgi:5-(aminomethyl)-3-furanmethanol phosphate kinase
VIVVKVGGSLFDHPRLGPGLRAYVDSLVPDHVLLVPGGGDVVEAVRKLDAIHGLGEEASHQLALRGMALSGEFLQRLIGESPRIAIPTFDLGDLPHSWDVTSDGIAARVAAVYRAERLVLLKSVDVPEETSWEDAAARGWVDAHFPSVVADAAFTIEVVNFRKVLDSLRE